MGIIRPSTTFLSPLMILLLTSALCCADRITEKPNIVLIISDDQAYSDFGFMGNKVVQTPHLDSLARRSACYVNGYVPTSVCRPSLATLLTGLYPHQHAIYFNHPPPGFARLRELSVAEWRAARQPAEQIIRNSPTLPWILAQHGYACLQTGKHWEGDYHNAGFTHGMARNLPSPEPAYGNLTLKDGIVAHGNGDAGLAIGRDTMEPILDFIDHHRDQPFFIWYAPFLPHVPFDAAPRFRRLYEGRHEVPEYLIGYFAEITRFDETVGRLVQSIEHRGLLDRTIFVFVADNGYRPTRQRDSAPKFPKADGRSKLSPYEDGLRTPILIRWDGRVQPSVHELPVRSVDIVPTILAAAGLERAIPDLPGLDLLPSATGQAPLADRPAFGELYPNDASALGNPEKDLLIRWIRHGDYKLIVPTLQAAKRTGNAFAEPLLYNLIQDPEESRNLAGLPEHAERVARLRRLLDDWWKPTRRSAIAEPKANGATE